MRLIEDNPEGVGYLLKERVIDGANLVDALRRVIDGETVVDPTIVARLLGRKRRSDPLAELTDREREALALVAEGLSNRAIAARLVITDRTVETHMTAIFGKLGLLRRVPTSIAACSRCWPCCARSARVARVRPGHLRCGRPSPHEQGRVMFASSDPRVARVASTPGDVGDPPGPGHGSVAADASG